MSVVSSATTVEVFKFKQSGIVALCQEVAAYVAEGDSPRNLILDADLSTGRYENLNGNHYIVFDRKKG